MVSVFLGYGSEPQVNRATLYEAAKSLTTQGTYQVTSWEDLRVDGQIIIDRILDTIESSEIALFDLTTLNPNVIFEVGFAIAKNRRLGLLLEPAFASAEQNYKRFGLLRDVGYTPWTDAGSIVARVSSGTFDAGEPIGTSLLSAAPPTSPSTVFFLPALHQSEPDTQIRNLMARVSEQRIDVVLADPTENRTESLAWYVAKAYTCAATLLHFESPLRQNHEIHNARLALVGGLAHGFGRELLMVADKNYDPPLDYHNLLKSYTTPKEAEAIVSEWFGAIELAETPPARRAHLELAVELRALRFGEHVAENEIHQLPNYFIETSGYRSVLTDHLTVFVGRKGTGKTANLFLAASQLRSDNRNLVVVIRPAAYDFEALVATLSGYSDVTKSHAVHGIWKLLLMTEVARVVLDELEGRPSGVPLTSQEQELLEGLVNGPIDLRQDFGSRINSAIHDMTQASDGAADPDRDRLNESLHTEWIGRLRKLLTPTVQTYSRVAFMVDNLDKGWERSADLDMLSDLLLGLLSAAGVVEREITREIRNGTAPEVSMALFLRSDIFAYLKTQAREPDKIVASTVEWDDSATLRRVIEERFLASRQPGTDPAVLWSRYFCPTVRGVPTADYLLGRVLPRPRDLIFLCNAAVSRAINRNHTRVEEDDVLDAEADYSLFAFEALLVENGITVSEFESVLLEFLGVNPVLTKAEVLDLIKHAGILAMRAEQVLTRLKAVSFLGIETAMDRFDYPEIGRSSEKAEILARKLAASDATTRHIVHPAYRPFLDISEPEDRRDSPVSGAQQGA